MPLSQSEDEAFSSESMGKGIVIVPREGKVIAPCDGTVSVLFPTKHAIGIISDSGVEILIHIGINTVNLNGKGFKTYINQGDRIKAGESGFCATVLTEEQIGKKDVVRVCLSC